MIRIPKPNQDQGVKFECGSGSAVLFTSKIPFPTWHITLNTLKPMQKKMKKEQRRREWKVKGQKNSQWGDIRAKVYVEGC
jgi:hypothetical protein